MPKISTTWLIISLIFSLQNSLVSNVLGDSRPNILLVMADDMGWVNKSMNIGVK